VDKSHESFEKDIFTLIETIQDENGKLKCYFQMLEKEIEAKNRSKSQQLYEKIKNQPTKGRELTPSLEL
jgi:hypothetical protein